MADDIVGALREIAEVFRQQTPSAPDWYRVIDTVVGTLLALEIERRTNTRNFASGVVTTKVREILAGHGKITAKQLRDAIPEASPKQIYNSIGYLVRHKQAHRNKYGEYEAPDAK